MAMMDLLQAAIVGLPSQWHPAVVDDPNDKAELCRVCGVRNDRAIHDPSTARRYGVRWPHPSREWAIATGLY